MIQKKHISNSFVSLTVIDDGMCCMSLVCMCECDFFYMYREHYVIKLKTYDLNNENIA